MHEATALMLQRVDAMEGELGALVESLRTGANRLSADLSLLSGNMGELYAAAGQAPSGDAPSVYEPPEIEIYEEAAVLAEAEQEEDEVEALAADEPAAEAEADGADAEDVEGARLIALNMALNGQTREETDKYLAQNFDLSDRSALLDEVYATVEG